MIFGTRNLQTLIEELLLMPFKTYLMFVLNCISDSDDCLQQKKHAHALFSLCSLRDH